MNFQAEYVGRVCLENPLAGAELSRLNNIFPIRPKVIVTRNQTEKRNLIKRLAAAGIKAIGGLR